MEWGEAEFLRPALDPPPKGGLVVDIILPGLGHAPTRLQSGDVELVDMGEDGVDDVGAFEHDLLQIVHLLLYSLHVFEVMLFRDED